MPRQTNWKVVDSPIRDQVFGHHVSAVKLITKTVILLFFKIYIRDAVDKKIPLRVVGRTKPRHSSDLISLHGQVAALTPCAATDAAFQGRKYRGYACVRVELRELADANQSPQFLDKR